MRLSECKDVNEIADVLRSSVYLFTTNSLISNNGVLTIEVNAWDRPTYRFGYDFSFNEIVIYGDDTIYLIKKPVEVFESAKEAWRTTFSMAKKLPDIVKQISISGFRYDFAIAANDDKSLSIMDQVLNEFDNDALIYADDLLERFFKLADFTDK